MKRTAKSKSAYLDNLSLYLDDIEQILALLGDNCKEITASGMGYEIERPREIDEYKELTKEQFKSLEIKGLIPYVTMSTYKHTFESGIYVYISGDDTKSLGLFTAIVDILKKRQNRLITIYKSIFTYFLITVLIISTWLYLNTKYNLGGPALILALIVWVAIYFYIPGSRILKLNKEYSNQKRNFFVRNRDQIILLLIGALFGFGFALLLKTFF